MRNISTGAIPFLAYNHRRGILLFRNQWRRSRRTSCPISSEETPLDQVDPYDVAVLLALAQGQRKALSKFASDRKGFASMAEGQSQYTTHVIAISSTSPDIALFTADISASYLDCLEDLSLPVVNPPVIHCSRIPVTSSADEFLDMMHAILTAASLIKTCGKGKTPKRSAMADLTSWDRRKMTKKEELDEEPAVGVCDSSF